MYKIHNEEDNTMEEVVLMKSEDLVIGDIISVQFINETLTGTTSKDLRHFNRIDHGIVVNINRSGKYGTSIMVKVFDNDDTVWTIMLDGRYDVVKLYNIKQMIPSHTKPIDDGETKNIKVNDRKWRAQYSALRGEIYIIHKETDTMIFSIQSECDGNNYYFNNITDEVMVELIEMIIVM